MLSFPIRPPEISSTLTYLRRVGRVQFVTEKPPVVQNMHGAPATAIGSRTIEVGFRQAYNRHVNFLLPAGRGKDAHWRTAGIEGQPPNLARSVGRNAWACHIGESVV